MNAMRLLKSLNLALAFLLELGLLGAVAVWAFALLPDSLWGFGLAFVLVVTVVAVWGAWAAPRSRWRLRMPWLYALKIALFAIGVAALLAAGQPILAAMLGGLAALNLLLALVWRQEAVG